MISSNYQIINDLINYFQDELDQINIKMKNNLIESQDVDCNKHSLFENSNNRDCNSLMEDNEELVKRKEQVCFKIQQLQNLFLEEKEQNYITLNIQEADRQRIARDLHDTSLQNLAHLVHKIELSSMYIEQDPLRAKLELSVINKNLKTIIEEIRNTIFNLRPMSFDDLGMKAALENLVSLINENRRYEMDVEIDDVSCETNLVLVSLYRVIQESFTNIIKHAEATKIFFHCHLVNNQYQVVIKDNGKGFCEENENRDQRHFGLLLMKERIALIGGTISIQSGEEGTKIEISVPIE